MSPAHVALGWASRLVVIAWIAAALVALAKGGLAPPVALEDIEERSARIRPWIEEVLETHAVSEREAQAVPEPEAKVVAAEPPAPEPAAAESRAEPMPESVAVDPGDLAAGATLLDGQGRFPPLSSSYGDFGSFGAYASAMRSLGARFVVVRQRQIVGDIDPATGAMRDDRADARFSPRARDYSDEPALERASHRARERFGPGARVMMLVPRGIDAALFGAIARRLRAQGDAPSELREIRARYRRGPAGGVELRVEGAERLDGAPVPLDLVFDLSAVAGLGEGA